MNIMKTLTKLWIGIITAVLAIVILAVAAPQFYKSQQAASLAGDLSGLVAIGLPTPSRVACGSQWTKILEGTVTTEAAGAVTTTVTLTQADMDRLIKDGCSFKAVREKFATLSIGESTLETFDCAIAERHTSTNLFTCISPGYPDTPTYQIARSVGIAFVGTSGGIAYDVSDPGLDEPGEKIYLELFAKK